MRPSEVNVLFMTHDFLLFSKKHIIFAFCQAGAFVQFLIRTVEFEIAGPTEGHLQLSERKNQMPMGIASLI